MAWLKDYTYSVYVLREGAFLTMVSPILWNSGPSYYWVIWLSSCGRRNSVWKL